MNWINVTMVSSLLLLIGYVPCTAQEVSVGKLYIGGRVRVQTRSLPKRSFMGTVVAVGTDTLSLDTTGRYPMAIPLTSVASIEMSNGSKRNIGKGALLGFLVGASSGVLMGAISGSDEPGVTAEERMRSNTAELKMLTGGFLLGASGLLWGTIIGAFVETEIWNPVALYRINLDLAPQHQGGLKLLASVAF